MITMIDVAFLHSSEPRFASLANRMDDYPDIVVIKNTTDWNVLASCAQLQGSIVILDAQLKDTEPILERVRQLRLLGARAILLDGDDSPTFVIKAMGAGADASLDKRVPSRRIVEQIRLTASRARLIKQHH